MHGQLSQLQNLDPTSKWLIIIAAGLTILYAVLRPLKRKKDPLARPPAFSSLASQRSVEREMSNLLVELSEMARQITAQLDTRAAKLELLIKEADEKIAQLSRLTKSGAAVSEVAETPRSEPSTVDPRHAEVYALADAGQSTKEIAQQLTRPHGEIELILALRGTP